MHFLALDMVGFYTVSGASVKLRTQYNPIERVELPRGEQCIFFFTFFQIDRYKFSLRSQRISECTTLNVKWLELPCIVDVNLVHHHIQSCF